MKNILIALFLFCLSCAPPFPSIKAGNGSSIYFCGKANYLFHYSIPVEKIMPMFKAFQYWNGVLGKNIFDGEEKHDTHIYVVVDKRLAGTTHWARTDGNVNGDGCLTTAVIVLNPDVFALSDNEVETIVRHELGHTLSLDESFNGVQVMLPELPIHPLPVTQEQVDYIKKNVLRD